jgi:ribose transport system permease protein
MPAETLSLGVSEAAEPPPVFARRWTSIPRYGALLAFAVIFAGFALRAPGFFSIANLGAVLAQSAILGVLAFGLTTVAIGGGSNIVSGGIDLSLAANVGLGGAIQAVLLREGCGDATAATATLAAGLAIGALNAGAVVYLRIVPLLATLAVMNLAAGLELVLTENTVVSASSPMLDALGGNGPFGIPVLGYALLGAAAVLTFIIQGTRFGLRLYAAGEFPEAARAAGLRVEGYVAASYLISGLCGGLGAILSVAYLSGSTTGASEMLLSIIVTGFLGVVFSQRLVPTIPGALLSALFIGVLLNGFQLLNVSSYWVSGVEGLLILAIVAATSVLRRQDVAT